MLPGAARMVVGHTIQDAGINGACGGRVLRIDVGLSAGCGDGEPQARGRGLPQGRTGPGCATLACPPLRQAAGACVQSHLQIAVTCVLAAGCHVLMLVPPPPPPPPPPRARARARRLPVGPCLPSGDWEYAT